MSLTYENIEDRLTTCFLQEWGDTTPVVLKNQQAVDIEDGEEAWVRFSVLRTASQQDSLGSTGTRRFLRMGRIYVQVFVRVGSITSLLNELCTKVVTFYERTGISPIRVQQIYQQDFLDGADEKATTTGDGAWFGSLINIQFAFDEIK